MSQLILIERILVNLNEAKWPSGLRRQFQVLVFGRGFEPHLCQAIYVLCGQDPGRDLPLNHCIKAERIENKSVREETYMYFDIYFHPISLSVFVFILVS